MLVDGKIGGHQVIFTASSCFTNAAITDKQELFLRGLGRVYVEGLILLESQIYLTTSRRRCSIA